MTGAGLVTGVGLVTGAGLVTGVELVTNAVVCNCTDIGCVTNGGK